MQHKREAWWFYRFLSIFYDKYVNPLFWTERMRDESLSIAQLDEPDLKIIDVGSGTGFTTEGIVSYATVSPEQVTCIDQSPHQMAKAKQKATLQGCTFQIGDAENLPVPTDTYDRYVSAGSIEYWPNPDRGVTEAYRVIKPGGIATLIGPLEPVHPIGRFLANTWMLFPKEEEYRRWYEEAGFEDIQVRYTKPHWHDGPSQYCISISGRKPAPGLSPAHREIREEAPESAGDVLESLGRIVLGSVAGFGFIPIALYGYLRRSIAPAAAAPDAPEGTVQERRLTPEQKTALGVAGGVALVALIAILANRRGKRK